MTDARDRPARRWQVTEGEDGAVISHRWQVAGPAQPMPYRSRARLGLRARAAFEGLQAALAANRSEFYRAVPSGPFYNFDQQGVEDRKSVV